MKEDVQLFLDTIQGENAKKLRMMECDQLHKLDDDQLQQRLELALSVGIFVASQQQLLPFMLRSNAPIAACRYLGRINWKLT